MSESLIYLSELLIRSFLGKKWAIRSENRWANSQPCKECDLAEKKATDTGEHIIFWVYPGENAVLNVKQVVIFKEYTVLGRDYVIYVSISSGTV